MSARRFKVRELSETKKFEGEITIADLRRKFGIPKDADVFVRVPGGGDWSHTNLPIEDDRPIMVKWEEVKNK